MTLGQCAPTTTFLCSVRKVNRVISDVDLVAVVDAHPVPTGPFLPSYVRGLFANRPDSDYIESIYVNPARASLDAVVTMLSQEIYSFTVPVGIYPPRTGGGPRSTCLLTSGMVSRANLCVPYSTGVGAQSFMDRRVAIYPFDHEYQRTLRFLGSVANIGKLIWPFHNGSISFCTQVCLPVFDARASHLVFDSTLIAGLELLPLYADGELPVNALVTVGHTSTIFLVTTPQGYRLQPSSDVSGHLDTKAGGQQHRFSAFLGETRIEVVESWSRVEVDLRPQAVVGTQLRLGTREEGTEAWNKFGFAAWNAAGLDDVITRRKTAVARLDSTYALTLAQKVKAVVEVNTSEMTTRRAR
ncbi:hypothetical protein DFP72DRAFT_843841 [Ephemerocybe angulata]|uniref:Uncharacterized protein n=1 Tax=Ephemerocybe angulata TaxID=980116 RepID=A0A8H6I897_9AGAR|nr:hypothetical protein DFP72DRAFT_843841 [Tulosesus angulatus]